MSTPIFKAELKGLDQTLQNMDKVKSNFVNDIDKLMNQWAIDTASMARVMVPVKTGSLRTSIAADTSRKLSKTVEANAPYAAYVEFGTGSEVFKGNFQFTPDMKEYASQFIVNGKGKLPAHPYLFPSYVINRKKLIQLIEARLRKREKI